jgi:AcrR family transcriptional regulator
MFKTARRPTPKSEVTRRHVLQAALKLFRRRGFERTTMREIADAAGLSLGAAYHHFRSKEELLLAYYEWLQSEHERLFLAACPPNADFRTRLATLLETKLTLLAGDRKLLAALFGDLGDTANPLSVFGKKTLAIRERSVAQFVSLLRDTPVPDDLREPLGRALWLSHLGVFLHFVHDRSKGHARTRRLVETLVELATTGLPLLAHPQALPVRGRLLELLT